MVVSQESIFTHTGAQFYFQFKVIENRFSFTHPPMVKLKIDLEIMRNYSLAMLNYGKPS